MANSTVTYNGSTIVSLTPSTSSSTKTLSCANKVMKSNVVVTCASDSNLVSANILSGKSIFGVSGSSAILRISHASGTSVTSSGTVRIYQTERIYSDRTYIDITSHGFTPTAFYVFEWHYNEQASFSCREDGLYCRGNTEYAYDLSQALFTSSHCYLMGGYSTYWDYSAQIFGY